MKFGRRYRVGNYSVIKFNKTLRKQEVAALRRQMGIPADEWKNLQRAQLPYIKVEAASGIWAIEFCCNTMVYRMIDEALGGVDIDASGVVDDLSGAVGGLLQVFNIWFMDTTVMGDDEYLSAKAAALQGFMGRIKAPDVSKEDDDAVVDGVRSSEEQKDNIVSMCNDILEKEASEGGVQ